jgi:hypothetical protein
MMCVCVVVVSGSGTERIRFLRPGAFPKFAAVIAIDAYCTHSTVLQWNMSHVHNDQNNVSL